MKTALEEGLLRQICALRPQIACLKITCPIVTLLIKEEVAITTSNFTPLPLPSMPHGMSQSSTRYATPLCPCWVASDKLQALVSQRCSCWLSFSG